MPNYFKLFNKETKAPVSFAEIDELLCKELEVEVDPEFFVLGWVDAIGMIIATTNEPLGSPELNQKFENVFKGLPTYQKIIDFLTKNYVSQSGYVCK